MVEVNPGTDRLAVLVAAVPAGGIITRFHCFINEGSNFPAQEIINNHADIAALRQIIENICYWVEWIGEVVMQGITVRYRFQGDRLGALADNFLIIIKYCIGNSDISVISI